MFPFGTYDESAFRILKECGIQYARNPGDTHGFALQSDLLRFNPSFHHTDADIMSGIDRFLNMDTDEPQLLYIWGHSYEFDVDDNWEYMESTILVKSCFHSIFVKQCDQPSILFYSVIIAESDRFLLTIPHNNYHTFP